MRPVYRVIIDENADLNQTLAEIAKINGVLYTSNAPIFNIETKGSED